SAAVPLPLRLGLQKALGQHQHVSVGVVQRREPTHPSIVQVSPSKRTSPRVSKESRAASMSRTLKVSTAPPPGGGMLSTSVNPTRTSATGDCNSAQPFAG